MGAFYGKRIHENLMTIDDVPPFWLEKTKKWLNENPEEN